MKNYLEDLTERDHKMQYYLALEIAEVSGPDWDELTEQQREDLRNIHLVQIRAVIDVSDIIATEQGKK